MAPGQNYPNDVHRMSKIAEKGENKAFVTFLGGSGDYVKGVVGLAKGLRKVGSAYPLVVAVLPDVPPEHRLLMVQNGCVLKDINWVQAPEMDKTKVGWAHEHFAINYSKLRIFELEEYSKMVYFDGDIQVYSNVDELFELPNGHLYGVLDCFCEWHHSPQYKIGYCQQCPDRVQWPAEMGQPPSSYFNAGMFVFEPSQATYDDLINTIKVTPPSSFAEQDLLNLYFKSIFEPIPPVYNLLVPMLWTHPEHVELDKVKVVHFCANGSKPWRYTGKDEHMQREDVKMLVQKWWDIYDDESFSYREPMAANVGGKRVQTAELNLIPKEKGKRGLGPMVTSVLEFAL
ncbi:Hexosyltransferase [Heracleum sosnowskyi]|uniref:Hexosyltransferase n=1 Tax=Heracleum sosnowskyi TaxID=360622 RepID=A0AAD8IIG4_9APIA|nr:Hexosyltransferase [Heracleum sosnowskyi]